MPGSYEIKKKLNFALWVTLAPSGCDLTGRYEVLAENSQRRMEEKSDKTGELVAGDVLCCPDRQVAVRRGRGRMDRLFGPRGSVALGRS